jgi:cell division protein FtsQ
VRVLQLTALAAALVASGFVALHSPLLAMRRVVLVGAAHESRAAVLATSGLVGHPPLIDVDPGAAATRLLRLPYVATATVERSWPSAVRVVITERQPVAFSALGSDKVALLDATGRILADAVSPPAGLVSVVGIGGLPAPGGEVGPAAAAVLAAVAALPASLLAEVSDFGRSASNGIVLQLAHGPLVILGTSSDLSEKYVALVTLARSATTPLAAAKTVDLRVPDAPVLTP